MTRTMYDSVDPYAIPANAQMVAGYIDGSSFRWPVEAWSRFPNAVKVRIARRTTTNDGNVLDVEEGIPTVWPPGQGIIDWVLMRRRAGVEPSIYCNQLNDWSGIRRLFQNANIKEPYYWVARYNNIAVIPDGAVAKQYANSVLAKGPYDVSIVVDHWPGVDKEGDSTMSDTDLQNNVYTAVHNLFIDANNPQATMAREAMNALRVGLGIPAIEAALRDLAGVRADVDEEALAAAMAAHGIGGVSLEQMKNLFSSLRVIPTDSSVQQ